ncbi:MAG TPA: glycosyltransferase family 39 protein [Candidatus Magasanikbacteria bacterium]|nr:glycosyltransferase family 39 protein [Candidatus Magasanikbacteria bacterium]
MIKKVITKFHDFFAADWSVFLVYAISVLAVYARTLGVGFFSDDYHMLSVFSSGINPFRYIFSNIVGELGSGSYGPLFALFHYLEFKLFDLNALLYHLVALILHSVNAFLVYVLVRKLSGRRGISVASGLMFALAAHQVSAVVWIAVLPHLLATLLALASIIVFVNYVRGSDRGNYWLSILFYTLSLCAKENAMFLPIVLLLVFLFEKRQDWQKKFILAFVHILPFVIVVFLFFLARRAVTGTVAGFYAQSMIILDLAHYRSMFFDLLADLFTDHPLRAIWHDRLFRHWVIGALFFASPLLVTLACWREKSRAAVLYFFAFLFGTIPFLPLLLSHWDDGGERYTYFISAFFWPYFFLGGVAIWRCFGNLWRDRIFARRFGIFLFAVFLGVNLVTICRKQDRWIESGEIVRRLIGSARDLNFENKYTVFVGLPDNLSGAEASRNAIIEAIKLETRITVVGERIPLYGALRIGQNPLYLAKKDAENGMIEIVSNKAGKTDFTGFKEYSRPFADFSLGDYVKPDMGAKIQIKPTNDVYWYGGHRLLVMYVYFDGRKLVQIDK